MFYVLIKLYFQQIQLWQQTMKVTFTLEQYYSFSNQFVVLVVLLQGIVSTLRPLQSTLPQDIAVQNAYNSLMTELNNLIDPSGINQGLFVI
jgi:hypothetical protein